VIDNTIVFFTSDNGPNLNRPETGCAGPLRCGKGTTWEGGMRVPAIAYWPGKVAPSRANQLIASLDLAPTFASLANITWRPDGGHGVDQTPLLLGEGVVKNRLLLLSNTILCIHFITYLHIVSEAHISLLC